MEEKKTALIGDSLRKALRPDLAKYEIYPLFLSRDVISFDTLLSHFLGYYTESVDKNVYAEELRHLAFQEVFHGILPNRCEDPFQIIQTDIPSWILWLFHQGAKPCQHMKKFLGEHHAFH